MICDDPVEERQHHEVQHDRDDHFMRAELHSKESRNGSDNSSTERCREHA